MSMSKRPYSYLPDEYFDFGELIGEQPVEFLAWIDDREPGPANVSILRVVVNPVFKSVDSPIWDITAQIKKYPERERKYEDEIRADFERAKENEEREAM